MTRRRAWNQLAEGLLQAAGLIVTVLGLGVLAVLLIDVAIDGVGRLSWQFLTSLPSRRPEAAGIYSALIGSIFVIGLTALLAIPIGIGAAIYLEEYAKRSRWSRVIEINIANLAGVPSIIYGLHRAVGLREEHLPAHPEPNERHHSRDSDPGPGLDGRRQYLCRWNRRR